MTNLERKDSPVITCGSNPKFVFLLVFSINLFNYIDRQILYAVFPLVKIDLSLSDTQLGMLASAFIIVYMIYAPLAGYFGDRNERQKWIGASAMLWSFATMLSGSVRSYYQLLFARSIVGVGEAGYTTMAPSYLAEHFNESQRARVLSLYSLALPVGCALGYLLGGHLGEHYGWRNAFLIVGVPGMALGLLALTLKDPARCAMKKESMPSLRSYGALFKNKVYMLTSMSQAMATFAIGGLAAWMPTYFNRYMGFSVTKASIVFGAMTVVAGTLGTLIGGFMADYLHKKTTRSYFIVTYWGFFLSVPLGLLALTAKSLSATIILLTITEVLVFTHSGPLVAAIISVTSLNMRSMAFAVNIFLIHVLGDAISPTLIGIVSDAAGLRVAVIACIMVLSLAGFFGVLASKYMPPHSELK